MSSPERLNPYKILGGNQPLAFLLVGQALSSLADWLLAVTLTVLVYDISHSATAVSFLTFARLAPYALVLPWSGILLDRTDPRLLMAGLGAGRGLCMICLIFVHSASELPLVFPLVFLSSTLSCVLRPTMSATLPDVVHEGETVAANSLVTQMDGLAHIIGPALGGLFVLVHQLDLALLVTSAAFLISGLAFFLAHPPPRRSLLPSSMNFSLNEVLAGFRFLMCENERVLLGLTLTAAGLALLGGAYYVLAVELSTKTFHLGGQGVGWLDAVYGIGGLVGSLLVGISVGERSIAPLFMRGAALSTVGVFCLALGPPGPAPFLSIAVVGMATVLVQVAGTTILQLAAPRDMLARAFTAFEAALVVAMLLGALLVGPLLTVTGPRLGTAVFAVAGALLLLASLPFLRSLDEVLGLRRFLRTVPVLVDLSRPALDELAPYFDRFQVPAGASIVREGDPGDRFFVIHSGEVEVSVGSRVIRRLGPTDYFGEVALLHPVPRTASVHAKTATELYSLDRSTFGALLQRVSDLAPRLTRDAAAHYVDASIPFLTRH